MIIALPDKFFAAVTTILDNGVFPKSSQSPFWGDIKPLVVCLSLGIDRIVFDGISLLSEPLGRTS